MYYFACHKKQINSSAGTVLSLKRFYVSEVYLRPLLCMVLCDNYNEYLYIQFLSKKKG